ncbi:uncharacterized protein LOC125546622 [Triticum urartu]|uniref:uncharacterized protein LOC125546622 n=1 Tax=Triticum urartu TaxID=4572 RepID=UPI0020445939|nr:uncharacterized protein LOC125546622 [Triticum urartu]
MVPFTSGEEHSTASPYCMFLLAKKNPNPTQKTLLSIPSRSHRKKSFVAPADVRESFLAAADVRSAAISFDLPAADVRDRRHRDTGSPPTYDLPSLAAAVVRSAVSPRGGAAADVRDHRCLRPGSPPPTCQRRRRLQSPRGAAAAATLRRETPSPVSDGRRRRRRRRPLRGDAAATCAEPQGRVRRSSQGVLAGRTQRGWMMQWPHQAPCARPQWKCSFSELAGRRLVASRCSKRQHTRSVDEENNTFHDMMIGTSSFVVLSHLPLWERHCSIACLFKIMHICRMSASWGSSR